jgi:phosphoenolpyruvate synthase/pyruvate phosphate dikinase
MANFVVDLGNDRLVSEVGGKARSLSVLLKHGFDVPQGFVITSLAFFGFLKSNGLFGEIRRLASEITRDNFKEKSAQARETILGGEIPKNVASEIDLSLYGLSAKCVSIRSSAVNEDSLKSSFAGLFDTFLNVKAVLPLVLENTKKCWASLFNERAVAYRIRREMPHLEGMAVIVQDMICAEVSGITFTVHPARKKKMLIEAACGIGELIVGGKVEPDGYVIDREEMHCVEKKIGKKNTMSVNRSEKSEVKDAEDELMEKQVISDETATEIAKTSLKVEELFDYPQDIEWCISNGKIWLLQSRPITQQ